MKVIETDIDGVVIIEPTVFGDDRGYFFESFREEEFINTVLKTRFVQDNEAKSNFGVLRGLHFQKGEFAQAKLLRVVKGAVLDVAVDLRKDSSTFGKYIAIEITEENKLQLFIPRGFAHGYLVLKNNTIFNYKCDNYYAPSHEGGINWRDGKLKIDWKINPSELVISNKDAMLPYLEQIIDFL